MASVISSCSGTGSPIFSHKTIKTTSNPMDGSDTQGEMEEFPGECIDVSTIHYTFR